MPSTPSLATNRARGGSCPASTADRQRSAGASRRAERCERSSRAAGAQKGTSSPSARATDPSNSAGG